MQSHEAIGHRKSPIPCNFDPRSHVSCARMADVLQHTADCLQAYECSNPKTSPIVMLGCVIYHQGFIPLGKIALAYMLHGGQTRVETSKMLASKSASRHSGPKFPKNSSFHNAQISIFASFK